MTGYYRSDVLRFSYPAAWEFTENQRDDCREIELTGPGTAFCTVVLLPDAPPPEAVLDAATQAFRDEYDDFDAYPVDEQIARRPAVGCDLDFFCLELCNSSSLRAFRTGRFTVLLMSQANSADVDAAQEAFEQICESMECDGDVFLGA